MGHRRGFITNTNPMSLVCLLPRGYRVDGAFLPKC